MLTNKLQYSIMRFATTYSREKKKPLPMLMIVKNMSKMQIPECTIKASIRTLVRKGFLRKAVGRQATFIVLRTSV